MINMVDLENYGICFDDEYLCDMLHNPYKIKDEDYPKIMRKAEKIKNASYLLMMMKTNPSVNSYISFSDHSFVKINFIINNKNLFVDLKNGETIICIDPNSKLFLETLKVFYEPLSFAQGKEVAIIFQTIYGKTIKEFDGIEKEKVKDQTFVKRFIDDFLSVNNKA